jgi:hypothetical protein
LAAHKYLWEKLQILHGDISIGNILLHRVKEDQEATGLLIDFDSAFIRKAADPKDGDDGVAIVKERVWTVSVRPNCRETANGFSSQGTPPFVAIEALMTFPKPYTHQPHHDLESILYVILYVCTYFKEPNNVRLSTDFPQMSSVPLERWFRRDNVKDIGRHKIGMMVTSESSILAKFTPYWDDFVPFVRRLIRSCFPHFPDFVCQIDHDGMIAILNEAYDTVEEPTLAAMPDESHVPSKRPRKTGPVA